MVASTSAAANAVRSYQKKQHQMLPDKAACCVVFSDKVAMMFGMHTYGCVLGGKAVVPCWHQHNSKSEELTQKHC